jgi:hypothetical protein
VSRTLHTFDELRDIVQGKPRFEITEITGRHRERPPLGGGASAFQPPAQRLIDDLAEGAAGAVRFRLELGSDVVIQGQRRPHALMLQDAQRVGEVRAGLGQIDELQDQRSGIVETGTPHAPHRGG